MYWKYLTGFLVIIVLILGLMPKIAGNLNDAYFFSQIDSLKYIPVKAVIKENLIGNIDFSKEQFFIIDEENNSGKLLIEKGKISQEDLNKTLIIKIKYNKRDNIFIALDYSSPGLFFTFPYIPGLEERSRIILFHVPIAWVSVLAFLISMFYGVKYLRRKNLLDDKKSMTSAGLGFLFCILATITGSIWAKFNWGSFWNWDPRETSIFILLLIYGAYFALRSAIETEERKAILSSIYSILAFITVPFFIFIMPRITSGLHPGSADDVSGSGPVIKSGMNFEMKIIFFISLIAFTLLFFWLFQIKTKIAILKDES